MKGKQMLQVGLLAVGVILTTLGAQAHSNSATKTVTLVDTVRQETARFKDVEAAKSAGYGLLHGCVSGPQEGAMGIHFANSALVGDNEIDAAKPEALMYEPRNGKMELVGVEYVVLAEGWHANHEAPPVLMGQLFNYVGSPNRYGIPAFYELHVWAWQTNPNGVFSDWNPRVSCEQYVGDSEAVGHH